MLCMGCCMYNLENNIPVEIRGCTAFAYSKDGNIIYGRNNDLPPYLRDGSKSEIYSPQNGNRFNITTSSFINGEEGLNEHGLAVAMTFVMTRLEKLSQALIRALSLGIYWKRQMIQKPLFRCLWNYP